MGSDRKILFRHRRALGDAIMFTAGVRDFKSLFPEFRVNVDTNLPQVWENNPYLDTEVRKGGEGVEEYGVGYPMMRSVNGHAMHFTSMFLFDMVAAVGGGENGLPLSLAEFCSAFADGQVGDPSMSDPVKRPGSLREPYKTWGERYRKFGRVFSRQRGDLHVSEAERKRDLIRDFYGVGTYWVVAPGGKRDATAKIWDWRRMQKVVDHFRGRIKFVTIGKSDLLNEKLRGVIDLTDRFNTDLRGLISLVYHADGVVTGPSALLHMAAAVPARPGGRELKPCVAVLGGREPASWTWYCGHQVLHTNGIFSCCQDGGCWQARTVALPKDPKHNERLCHQTVDCDGRTVQRCMDAIKAEDVIRSIERYYEGDLYGYDEDKGEDTGVGEKVPAIGDNASETAFEQGLAEPITIDVKVTDAGRNVFTGIERGFVDACTVRNRINVIGNLHTKGGGEQSLVTLARTLTAGGWGVKLYGFKAGVKDAYRERVNIEAEVFEDGGMERAMEVGIPLLFYGNDSVGEFAARGQGVVEKSSAVVIGVNYVNGPLPRCGWLAKSKKLRAVVFQNGEKRDEWLRDEVGYEPGPRLIVAHGAIELDRMLEVYGGKPRAGSDAELVVLKHCVPDGRKYVTRESEKGGEKKHVWQRCLSKERDVKLYAHLLKRVPQARFEFMEAHEELVREFWEEPRMTFHKWDAMPVEEFLARGHVYLYRTSNRWRDQYPRVVAEALAAGLPVLTEPRDGTADRVRHGDTGFYCVDQDGFEYALRLLARKEDYRQRMGREAKDWARINLRPERWVEILEEVLGCCSGM